MNYRAETTSDQTVFLLHGLAAHWLLLKKLESELSQANYNVRNWGYRSIWFPIDRHADRLAKDVASRQRDKSVSQIHFVAHSMGSIIVRRMMQRVRPEKLGRIVMLGPPNQGSHVATILSRPLGWLCPPLHELADTKSSFVNQLPNNLELDVGVIAAESDLVVSTSNTRLPTQKDWVSLPGHHSQLLWKDETARHIMSFLEFGHFKRPPN